MYSIEDTIKWLEDKGLYIIDEKKYVNNRIKDIINELGYSMTDLAELTGISRQRLNDVAKQKMIPSVEFALMLEEVLGIPVSKIFSLTDGAWLKPWKNEEGVSMYVNMITREFVTVREKRRIEKETGKPYYDINTGEYKTKKERDIALKKYLKDNLLEKKRELKPDYNNLKELESVATAEVKEDFERIYIKVFRKLGVKHNYIKINANHRD